jgi:biotin-(acetyl-CoA carboxylase) ligase
VEAELGKNVRASELLRAVLEELIAWRSQMQSPEFIQAWQSRLAYVEQNVRLNMGTDKMIDAQLQGLASDGSLRLRLPSGELRSFRMGEVQITPID